jgi:hypothetical protein
VSTPNVPNAPNHYLYSSYYSTPTTMILSDPIPNLPQGTHHPAIQPLLTTSNPTPVQSLILNPYHTHHTYRSRQSLRAATTRKRPGVLCRDQHLHTTSTTYTYCCLLLRTFRRPMI